MNTPKAPAKGSTPNTTAPNSEHIKPSPEEKAVVDAGYDPATTSPAEAARDNYITPEEAPASAKVTPPAETLLGVGPVGELQRTDKEPKGLDDPQPLPKIEGDKPEERQLSEDDLK